VIGPYAERAVTGGGGSSRVVPLYTVAPVDGIQKRAGANVRVSFSDGADAAKAAALAREADTAIVMVGATDTEGIFVGYRHYDAKGVEPLFPFGFGLSYTKFAYRNLSVTLHPFHSADGSARAATVEFELANSGTMPGAEVAEVYVSFPSTSAVPQPPKQLKGFHKVALQPGKETHIRLTLDVRAFSYWDVPHHGWAVMPGRYEILVGSSSRDIRLRKKLEIKFVDAQKQ